MPRSPELYLAQILLVTVPIYAYSTQNDLRFFLIFFRELAKALLEEQLFLKPP